MVAVTGRATKAKRRSAKQRAAGSPEAEGSEEEPAASTSPSTSEPASGSGAGSGSAGSGGPPGSTRRRIDTGPLGRYLRRPLWWVPVALFAGALFYALELEDVRADERIYGTGDPLPAVVADGYDGGDEIPVVYEHPLFGPSEASLSLSRSDAGPRPEPGDVVALRAARDNPFSVRLLRSDRARPALWVPLLFTLPCLVVYGRRWWTIRRTQRLIGAAETGPGPGGGVGSSGQTGAAAATAPAASQTLLGRLRPRRRRGDTLVLDLFAHDDTGPEDRPLCSVPVVSSLGLPLGGPVFEVEVHGGPRRFGRVVARVADGVLWPRRRALVLPRWLTPSRSATVAGPSRRGDQVDQAPPRLPTRRLRPPKQVWPHPSGRLLGAVGLLAAGLTVGVVGTLSIQREADRAESLPEGSVEAPAYAIGPRPDGLLDVQLRLPASADGDVDEGEGESEGDNDNDDEFDLHDAVVAVPNAAVWVPGTPLLVAVDPDVPSRAILVPEPYRTSEPLVWTWLPSLVAMLWLGRTVAWRRQVERATEDHRWRPVEVGVVGETTFVVSRPGAPSASCLVTMPVSSAPPPETIAQTLDRGGQVFVHGLPAPGEKLLLRFTGAVMATGTGAAVRDHPWRRRWRTLSRWLQRGRPPLGER